MLTDSQGRPVRIGARLGGGGEGEVHAVEPPEDGRTTPGSPAAAKLYAGPERTAERRAKLEVMIASAPEDPTRALGHATLAWPKELLFEDGRTFAGFLMPRVEPGSPKLIRFIHPSLYPDLFSWRHQIEIAANLAAGLSSLHAAGYVVGDLKGENVHVTPSCLVTFVDCDSIQLRDARTGRVFRCPKGTPEYTAPELQGLDFHTVDRTESSDAFALAVMICQLLLAGTHPFAGGSGQTREENIARGDTFLLGGRPPRTAPPVTVIPPEVRALLVECFRQKAGGRPRVGELATALAASREHLVLCNRKPDHHAYGDHLAACPWCEYESRVGIDPYGPKPKPVPPPKTQSPAVLWGGAPSSAGSAPPPVPRRWTPSARTLRIGALAAVLAAVFVATRVPPKRPGGEPVPDEPTAAEIRAAPSGGSKAHSRKARVQTGQPIDGGAVLTDPPEGIQSAVLRDAALAELIFARVGRFQLSAYETTNGAYARCVEAQACRPPLAPADLSDPERRFHPVAGVSRGDAETFCRWIGGRLPSETEWNAAAQREKKKASPAGSALAPAVRVAPVASQPANPLGIYDLAGNVREWVAGGQGIVRGGAWDQPRDQVRDAAREVIPVGSRTPSVGFRCAR